MTQIALTQAAQAIRRANRVVAFTGAGISVESGIPPFRGEAGLWARYDPIILDTRYFERYPHESWAAIKEIFYDFFGQAGPNAAHRALASLEKMGRLQQVITQNIDNLHQEAGSELVVEYHGTSHRLVCTRCGRDFRYTAHTFDQFPPVCRFCDGMLKPDFVFFGEGIPQAAAEAAFLETKMADVWLVIGTTGEVYPAALLPHQAKENGAVIIEINIAPSAYTDTTTDYFLHGKATEMAAALLAEVQTNTGV